MSAAVTASSVRVAAAGALSSAKPFASAEPSAASKALAPSEILGSMKLRWLGGARLVEVAVSAAAELSAVEGLLRMPATEEMKAGSLLLALRKVSARETSAIKTSIVERGSRVRGEFAALEAAVRRTRGLCETVGTWLHSAIESPVIESFAEFPPARV